MTTVCAGRLRAVEAPRFLTGVILNARSGSGWLLSDEPRIALPKGLFLRQGAWGGPTLTPQAILFYKATAYFGPAATEGERPQDEADFRVLLPALDGVQRTWLREAIASLHPDHPWLSEIAG